MDIPEYLDSASAADLDDISWEACQAPEFDDGGKAESHHCFLTISSKPDAN